MTTPNGLLVVRNLHKVFRVRSAASNGGGRRAGRKVELRAVDGVSLQVARGEKAFATVQMVMAVDRPLAVSGSFLLRLVVTVPAVIVLTKLTPGKSPLAYTASL